MKTCPYCGKEYSDDAASCAIDQQPLIRLIASPERKEGSCDGHKGSLFWQAFNALGRIIGFGFTIVGGIFALSGLWLVLDHNATIGINGVPSRDPWIKGLVLVVGLLVSSVGVLLLISRRYRPDLGDSPFSKRKHR